MTTRITSITFLGALALIACAGAASASSRRAGTVCSVFDRHPCVPTICSVFRRHPCLPEFEDPIGQDLRVTIDSRGAGEGKRVSGDEPVNTILGMFAALRACWAPPPEMHARAGMEMSVRFSFRRDGALVGAPRVTYVSHGARTETRDVYRQAIDQATDNDLRHRGQGVDDGEQYSKRRRIFHHASETFGKQLTVAVGGKIEQ